jgi:Holliday junction resolvasome RuvABC endonuclease subunit
MILLGVDPGLANFGWCLVEHHGHAGKDYVIELLSMGVIRTEKDKRRVLSSEDNVKRLQRIWGSLDLTMPPPKKPWVVCAESMSFTRNASASAKVAMTWGLLVALDRPILQRSPQDVKAAVTGSKNASKTKVEQALVKRFPKIPSLLAGVPRSRWEHAVDSLAVVMACLEDDLVVLSSR